MPTRCNRLIFIADLTACSTCFGHHYAHHQELESIIQVVAASRIWCLVFKLSLWCGVECCVSGLRASCGSKGCVSGLRGGCGAEGCVSGLQAAALKQQSQRKEEEGYTWIEMTRRC
jgi:hypothetical protein